MMEILRRYSFSIAIAVAILGYLAFFSGQDDEILQLSGYTMGTTFRLQFVGLPRELDRNRIQQEITTLLERLDRQVFSTYSETSELSRLNKSPVGVAAAVSNELVEVALLAREVSLLTDGAFDVTVGPLVNLWGFGPDASLDQVPPQEQIDAARSRVGYELLQIDIARSTLSRAADIYVDLSGIAKGYVVDQVADYFERRGITSYFLEIGGELKIKGVKPGGEFWVPAVEKPVDDSPQVYEILNSLGEELAIAGSGDYRNYFEVDGRRYSHEIDPRNGAPVSHNLAAVYVIDTSTARADALATAFMVLGYDEGIVLARSADLAVYFIVRVDNDFEPFFTEQFARYIDSEEFAI